MTNEQKREKVQSVINSLSEELGVLIVGGAITLEDKQMFSFGSDELSFVEALGIVKALEILQTK